MTHVLIVFTVVEQCSLVSTLEGKFREDLTNKTAETTKDLIR